MGSPFKNWRCGASLPQSGAWMADELRRGCIRKLGHSGPHRTRTVEWDRGATNLDEVRERAEKGESDG